MTEVESFDWSAAVVRVVDGDTVRLRLTRVVPVSAGFSATIYTTSPDGVSVRLIIVDTPERGDQGWREAREALTQWLALRPRVRVQTYASAGWDRMLGDLYTEGDRNDTATAYLLRAGYPPYLGTRG